MPGYFDHSTRKGTKTMPAMWHTVKQTEFKFISRAIHMSWHLLGRPQFGDWVKAMWIGDWGTPWSRLTTLQWVETRHNYIKNQAWNMGSADVSLKLGAEGHGHHDLARQNIIWHVIFMASLKVQNKWCHTEAGSLMEGYKSLPCQSYQLRYKL